MCKFGDQLDHGGLVERREGDTSGGFVHASHVFCWAEEPYAAGAVFVGFHAFETFECVVEDAGGWIEGEVLVGCYAGGEPAFGGGPFEGEHVVCYILVSMGVGGRGESGRYR